MTVRDPLGRPEKASALARDVMAEITRQDARRSTHAEAEARARRRKAVRSHATVAGVVSSCLILTTLNLTGTMPFGRQVEDPTPAEHRAAVRSTLNYAVREIDGYRGEHGRLPLSLNEVGAPPDIEWSYTVTGAGRYQVAVTVAGVTETYDSMRDADGFFADVRGGR
jgi:hypothetical protein